MTNVVIASAARTPVGSFLGSFANTPAHDLGATVLAELVKRAGIDASEVSETILGQVLTGGQGRDTLSGGAGKDVFVFAGNWGRDTITDFDLMGDKIQISGEVTRFKDFKAAARQKGDDVIYDAGGDGENVIVIENTQLNAMQPNDLIFA